MKKDDNLKEIVEKSTTYKEVMDLLGYRCKGGGSFRALKKRILKLEIDTAHFKGKAHGSSNTKKFLLSEILVENSSYQNNSSLKRRLIKEKILENKCYVCNINSWLGNKLVLQLDHKNGINNDNRIINLHLLCPNCHSQTPTFSGRNNKKMER